MRARLMRVDALPLQTGAVTRRAHSEGATGEVLVGRLRCLVPAYVRHTQNDLEVWGCWCRQLPQKPQTWHARECRTDSQPKCLLQTHAARVREREHRGI